jgi:hypothetical protein
MLDGRRVVELVEVIRRNVGAGARLAALARAEASSRADRGVVVLHAPPLLEVFGRQEVPRGDAAGVVAETRKGAAHLLQLAERGEVALAEAGLDPSSAFVAIGSEALLVTAGELRETARSLSAVADALEELGPLVDALIQ